MIIKTIPYYFLIAALSSGCNTADKDKRVESFPNPVVVDLAKAKETDSQIMLSQFAESISYIRLSDEPLIGDVSMSQVRINEDTIYVDWENIYKYTPEGVFVKTLFTEGAGPGEAKKYSFTMSAFNEKERYVTFHSINKLSYSNYSFDGNYLGDTDDYMADSITIKHVKTYYKDYQIFEYVNNHVDNNGKINMFGPHLFYARNVHDGSILHPYPNPACDEKATYKGRIVIGQGDLQYIHIDSLLWFKFLALDTLYSTSDLKTICPKYIFNTNGTFMDMITYTHAKVMDVHAAEVKNKKFVDAVLPLPDGGLMYTINGKLGIADNTGKTSGYTEKPVVNDIDDYLKTIDIKSYLTNRTFCVYKKHLYILVDAYRFFEEDCKPPFDNLTEDSSPVVVKIRLI
jgi:hypothetical protein